MNRDTITLPRSVVEQVLEALDYAADQVFCQDNDDLIAEAQTALVTALEQQPVSKPYKLPTGFVLLQTKNGLPVYAACLDGGRFNGWLMWKHPDGQWVSKRKLEDWEIMQAEDQRDYGIVQGD